MTTTDKREQMPDVALFQLNKGWNVLEETIGSGEPYIRKASIIAEIEGMKIDMDLDNSNTDTPGGWCHSSGWNAALDCVIAKLEGK